MSTLTAISQGTPDRIRILHVDDDPGFADLTADVLERQDERFEVESANDAAHGLERLSEGRFDCIVSDFEMPGRTGIDLLEAVRADYPDLPFILFTGRGSEEIASEAISAGVTDYLQKESGTDQFTVLANRIQNAIDHYRSLDLVHRSEQRLRRIVDVLPNILYVVDEDGTYLVANEALAAFHDRSVDEIEGATVEEVLSPAEAEQFKTHLNEVLETGESLQIPDIEVVDAHGERHVLEPRLFPYDANGDTTAVLGLGVDVTDRERRERDLDRTRERMHLALENTGSVIFDVDLDTGELERHGAFETFFELTREDVPTLDDHIERAVHPADRAAFRSFYEELMDGDRTEGTFEYRTNPEQGTVRWIRDAISLENGDNHEPAHAVGIARDVTAEKKHANALDEARERYEKILEYSSDFVMIVDDEGAVTYVSPSVEHVMGYDPAAVIGSDAFAFSHPDDRERATQAFLDLRNEPDEEFSIEQRSQHASGEWRWVEVRGRNYLDDPHIGGYLVNVRDITARKRHETELERVKDRFRSMIENASDIVTIVDPDGTVVFQSEPTRHILGYDPDELVGSSIFQHVHPEDRERVAARFVEATEEDETRTETIEFRMQRDDGTWIWMEATGRTDQPDPFDGYVINSREITERKEREHELTRERNRFQAAFDTVPEPAVHVLFEDGNPLVRRTNAAFEEVFGLDQDAITGQNLDALIVLDEDRAEASEINRLAADGVTIQAEVTRLAHDGPRPFRFTAKMMDLGDGLDRREGVATYVDLTEQHRREEELRRQNDRLDQFASVVSHDLRNPLNVATGRLDLATEDVENEHLETVSTALDRMEALIDDLLTLAREGRPVGDREPVDLAAVATASWNQVASADASLDVDADVIIDADESRVRQLLENLMRNAIDHGPANVHVRVGALSDGFFVEDDGPGIPVDHRESVFDPGFSTDDGGTGFGLTIVRDIAEAHGWSVTIAEGSAGGARFEFRDVERHVT